MKNTPLFLLMVLVSSTTIGQVNLTENQKLKLDSIASQDVPNDAPGIATAIISDGKLIYEKYVGFENLKDSLKIDKNSRFNIASNGKQFTALAILLLEEQGRLNLQDDITKFIPEVYKNQEDRITIQNLLNHTSGIRDIYDLLSLKGITWWQHTYDNQDVLDLVKGQSDLNFSPGSQYLYSNTNYILLAEIIERATEKSFVQYTNELFAKLNMNSTSFEDDHTSIQGPIAIPYFNFGTWSDYEWKWNVVGDGNIFSTLQDQIEWEKIVQGQGNPQISRGLINKSQQLENTSNFRYGYGLEFDEYKNLQYRFHEGATGAWKATVVRFENKDLSIVTMTNSGKTIPSMQTRQMVDGVYNLDNVSNAFLTEPEKTGEFVSEEEIIGTYLTANNFSFEFRKTDDGKFVLNRIGRGEVELVREADNIFQQKFDPAFKQEFTRNEQGEMVVTAYYTSHAPYSLVRANSDWNDYNFKSLNGNFFNGETDVELILEYDSLNNYKVWINGEENNGVLVEPTKLLANNYVIEFSNDESPITTFTLSADRIQNIKFERKM